MSQSGTNNNTGGGGGGTPILTILGDVGSITGNVVTIYADNAANQGGATVQFINSGTISTLQLSDQAALGNMTLGLGAGSLTQTPNLGNTSLGVFSGHNLSSGSGNTLTGNATGNAISIGSSNSAYGSSSLRGLTSGNNNTSLGFEAGFLVLTGSDNVFVGYEAGFNYNGAESSNIIIGENLGTRGESNVIRIGNQGTGAGQQNKTFIAGIVGVTSSNAQFVTINSATGQLGVTNGTTDAYRATAISTQVLVTDDIIGVTSNAAARTITMPNAGMVAGQQWTIKDEAGTAQSSNNITISGNGANIDGAATFVINTNFGSATLYWNGTNFFVI